MGLNPNKGDVLPAAARGKERFVSCRRLKEIRDTVNTVVVTTGSADLCAMDGILADDTVVTSSTAGSNTP